MIQVDLRKPFDTENDQISETTIGEGGTTAVYHDAGNRFEVDVLVDGKTGGFLDQAENHATAGRYATGEALDRNSAKKLPAGSFGYWPAGMKHTAWSEGDTVIQLHGVGPWQINYVNPADDPRNAKK